MAYLNCPTCRLTVYRPHLSLSEGKASRLFQSALPPRLLESQRGEAPSGTR